MKSREEGGLILIVVMMAAACMVAFFFFVMFIAVICSGGGGQAEAVTGGSAAAATWGDHSGGTNQVPGAEDSVDLRQGGLKCISLPGVRGTPAVDRRVYPWLMDANRDATEAGLPRLTYTWAFRTNAQQRAIKSTYGPKAPVNSSYHEAGAAIDVNGMPGGFQPRRDGYQIVEIFRQHKATWLGGGGGDPPHFQWNYDVLGEPSRYQMIRRAQEAYNRGEVEGNCLGGPTRQ